MRKVSYTGSTRALTLIELLIVVAVIAVLAALLLPVHSGPSPSFRVRVMCMSNLKQVGVGMAMWATDHGERFPAQVPVTNGGSLELIGSGSPAPHFQALKETRLNPRLLVCPTDKARLQVTNYSSGLADRNISYFLSLDATPTLTNTQTTILAGDRNLQVAGKPVKPGLFPLTTNAAAEWTDDLHKNPPKRGGNVLFVDGHVAWPGTNLTTVIRDQGLATNRLAFP